MLTLLTLLIAADWAAWYDTQAKLRSVPPKAEQQRWLSGAQDECQQGDATACVYMLTFRHYDLKVLSAAAEHVIHKCVEGDRATCEGALYLANRFAVIYYDHPLSQLRERFPQDVYQTVCLKFGSACAKLDLKACREDTRCVLSEEEQMLIQMRQGLSLNVDATCVRALAKDCAETGVASCRPREMSFFKRDCPSGAGCFIAAYDMFLRTSSATHEAEMYGVMAGASPATPVGWLTDARIAQCLRGQTCDDAKLEAKDRDLVKRLKALQLPALAVLDVYTLPATAIVVNELIEKQVRGNAKLAEALALLETRRADFNAARKQKAREGSALQALLPSPRSASQSAMRGFIMEREANIAAEVARYER